MQRLDSLEIKTIDGWYNIYNNLVKQNSMFIYGEKSDIVKNILKKRKMKKTVRKRKNGKDKPKDSILSNWTKRWIKAILMFLVAVIIVLSFPYFDKADMPERFLQKFVIF